MKHIEPLPAGLTDDEYDHILRSAGAWDTGTLMARMGLEITRIGYDFAEGRVPVEGNLQPAGLFHGGGHVVLAESLASMHSYLRAGGNVVGVDLNATHIKAARQGTVYGRAEVIHAGGTLINHEVRMTNDAGELLSIVRITNLVMRPR